MFIYVNGNTSKKIYIFALLVDQMYQKKFTNVIFCPYLQYVYRCVILIIINVFLKNILF